MDLVKWAQLTLCLVLLIPAEQSWAKAWNEVYAEKASAVVYILGLPKGRGKGGISGTGSIIDRKGTVLTNAHIVIDNEQKKPFAKLRVFLKPDRIIGKPKNDLMKQYQAKLIAINQNFDLALLQILDPPANLPVMQLGDPGQVVIGENVAAIGHPEQGGLWSLTTGVVSAEFEDFQNRKGWNLFQTDASLNRGNSGGPLVNNLGYLVGVNVLVARMAKDGFVITDINFSIKSTVVQEWMREQGIGLPFGKASGTLERSPAESPKPMVQRNSSDRSFENFNTRSIGISIEKGPQLLTEPNPYEEEDILEWYVRLEQDLDKDADEMRSLIDRFRRK